MANVGTPAPPAHNDALCPPPGNGRRCWGTGNIAYRGVRGEAVQGGRGGRVWKGEWVGGNSLKRNISQAKIYI